MMVMMSEGQTRGQAGASQQGKEQEGRGLLFGGGLVSTDTCGYRQGCSW